MQTFSFRKLVQIIREEFEEAPDLRVTAGEAARFWALDLSTCERVLTELLHVGFLALGADARYRQTTVPRLSPRAWSYD
jgi:DNA-binding IclR family transcriptional regulator